MVEIKGLKEDMKDIKVLQEDIKEIKGLKEDMKCIKVLQEDIKEIKELLMQKNEK